MRGWEQAALGEPGRGTGCPGELLVGSSSIQQSYFLQPRKSLVQFLLYKLQEAFPTRLIKSDPPTGNHAATDAKICANVGCLSEWKSNCNNRDRSKLKGIIHFAACSHSRNPQFYSFIIIFHRLFKVHTMAFLRNLFTRSQATSAKQHMQTTLQQLRLDSPEPLPDNYHELLFPASSTLTHAEILREIARALPLATTEAAVVKIYTILMCALRMDDYEEESCEALEQLQEAGLAGKEGVLEMEKSCRSYLARLPSTCDLYRSALAPGPCNFGGESHVALFRLMNQFSLLFPVLGASLNTAGRYYKETLLYYKEFYRVWRAEVLLGYLSFKKMVEQILQDYRKIDPEVLSCFLRSVPEIELLCDHMEALITNKYFRGKSPNKKVEFSEEILQEMEYYLAGTDSKKEEEFIRTADDDFFAAK